MAMTMPDLSEVLPDPSPTVVLDSERELPDGPFALIISSLDYGVDVILGTKNVEILTLDADVFDQFYLLDLLWDFDTREEASAELDRLEREARFALEALRAVQPVGLGDDHADAVQEVQGFLDYLPEAREELKIEFDLRDVNAIDWGSDDDD